MKRKIDKKLAFVSKMGGFGYVLQWFGFVKVVLWLAYSGDLCYSCLLFCAAKVVL